MLKLNKTGQKVNLAKILADHIAGESHTNVHRRIAGGGIMAVSTAIEKTSSLLCEHQIFTSIVIGAICMGLHGIGLIPFVTSIEKLSKNS